MFVAGNPKRKRKQQKEPPLDFEKLGADTSDELISALKAEMLQIIGDKPNVRSMNELARFAHTAQELMMIRTPLAQVRRRRRSPGGASIGPGMQMGYSMMGSNPYQELYDCDIDPLTSEAAFNETYGANMSREMVSALSAAKRSGPPLDELIKALGEAKAQGLTNLAEKLAADIDRRLGESQQPQLHAHDHDQDHDRDDGHDDDGHESDEDALDVESLDLPPYPGVMYPPSAPAPEAVEEAEVVP